MIKDIATLPQETTTRYSLWVKNRPGELAKLTRFLADAGVSVSGLRVSSLGERSYIEFGAPRDSGLREGLRKRNLPVQVE